MKVLHIGTEMAWRGGENQVLLLAQGLKKLGVHNYFSYPDGAEALHRMKLGPSLAYRSQWPLDNRPIKDLKDWVLKNEIQILHAHSSGAHSIALKIKKKLPHIKLIVHRRVAFEKKTIQWSQSKYLSPLVDAYIAISEAVKSTLKARGVSQNKIFVVPSAVQLSSFNSKNRKLNRDFNLLEFSKKGYSLNNETVLIGTASAFTKEKGLDLFIQSLQELDKEESLPPFAVLMAGEGHLRKNMQQELERMNLKTPWVMTGFHDDIPSFLMGLDIFVMPSLFEGLGSVALEALAAQCCVISSNAGGLKEFIIDNETGLIFNVGDEEQLTQQLRNALTDETLRKRLGKKGLSLIENNYSVEGMVKGCWSVYQQVLRK